YRDNELRVQWVGESDWTYTGTFVVRPELLKRKQVALCCEGLDTFAEIYLNGKRLGKTNNQFRTWEFECKKRLIAGKNRIEIRFKSPIPYGREKLRERYLENWGAGSDKIPGGNYIRKSACNWGWDWGIRLVSMGIWRPIELL